MPKSKVIKPKPIAALSPKFKFDKTFVAVVAAVVVATGGYLFYQGTHAASAPFATYGYGSPMLHSTGAALASKREYLDGNIVSVPVWQWRSNVSDSFTKFLQFGPYVNVTIPAGYSGLHVCYYYSASNDLDKTGQTIKVYHDLTFVIPGSSVRGIYTPPNHVEPESIPEENAAGGTPIIRAHCFNYPFGSKVLNYVEFRLMVQGRSDGYAHLDLWKTTVSYY